MIIEIYGLPGAGKTTLAKKISAEFNIPLVKIRRKTDLIFYNLFYFLLHPVAFLKAFWYVFINSPNWRLFYYKFLNSFLHTNAKYQKALRCNKALVDQGHFQNVISVFEEAVDERGLLRYARILPRPDLLVIFDVPDEVREKHLSERGFSVREQFNEEYFNRWKKVVKENNNLFLRLLNELSVNFLIIRNNEDVKKIHEYLS